MLTPRPDGAWDLHLGDPERTLLASLAGQLEELIDEEPDDPGLRRLNPTAYVDDPEQEAAYQLLAGDELRSSRRRALGVLQQAAELTVLDEEQVTQWVQAINAIRLVVGTRLDVSEDDEGPVDPDDPAAPLWAVYEFLGELLFFTVRALSGR